TGCHGGWSEFGAKHIITRSNGNILYEIDGEPALDLYKKYLGDYAIDLPNSGLRFPLSIKEKDTDSEVIRTLLAIDEQDKSITFAGDVPEGYYARLMKPDIDVLIEGAGIAAKKINQANNKQALALTVSCVGRKIIMNQLVEEELESVQNILGKNVQLTGFYSYGEFAPFETQNLICKLHNQTMTLTVIYEN
ncbi:MAG: FIST C-terminal domain-containing protein, partial [Pseudomonadota bacterium]